MFTTTTTTTNNNNNNYTEVKTIGFIGLGAMGLPMALNVANHFPKAQLWVHDIHHPAVEQAIQHDPNRISSGTPREMANQCQVIITMLPNDQILKHVCCDPDQGFMASFTGLHISCSTVHPDTSRELAKLHQEQGAKFLGAPVFARADGVALRQASIVMGGLEEDDDTRDFAKPFLDAMAQQVFEFGKDPGAGNVVKLCGNFMIAAAIESCAEAMSLAEKNGLDRVAVMDMLTSTIFDCLIYKGYGSRTAHRQHIPNQPLVGPGFQLDLGYKDISLTRQLAQQVEAPMPVASLLQDRLLACKNKYSKVNNKLDWSALGLLASEEAGIDISSSLVEDAQSTTAKGNHEEDATDSLS